MPIKTARAQLIYNNGILAIISSAYKLNFDEDYYAYNKATNTYNYVFDTHLIDEGRTDSFIPAVPGSVSSGDNLELKFTENPFQLISIQSATFETPSPCPVCGHGLSKNGHDTKGAQRYVCQYCKGRKKK